MPLGAIARLTAEALSGDPAGADERGTQAANCARYVEGRGGVEDARAAIDRVDEALALLLAVRSSLAGRAAALRSEAEGKFSRDRERERWILARVDEAHGRARGLYSLRLVWESLFAQGQFVPARAARRSAAEREDSRPAGVEQLDATGASAGESDP